MHTISQHKYGISLYQEKYILLETLLFWAGGGIYFSNDHVSMDEYYLLQEWDSFKLQLFSFKKNFTVESSEDDFQL